MITPAAPLVAGFHHMSTRPRSVPVQRSHLSVVGALGFCVRDPTITGGAQFVDNAAKVFHLSTKV